MINEKLFFSVLDDVEGAVNDIFQKYEEQMFIEECGMCATTEDDLRGKSNEIAKVIADALEEKKRATAFPMITVDENDHLIFISNSGTEYSIYEGSTIGATENAKKASADIAYFMLDGYDCSAELAYWCYGADSLLDMSDVEFTALADVIDKWEEEHPFLIKCIKSGAIKKLR